MARNGADRVAIEHRMTALETKLDTLTKMLVEHMENEDKEMSEVRSYLSRLNFLLITTLLALAIDFGSRLIPSANAFM